LNNVVFDGTQPLFDKDIATHYTLGPGPVSFSNEIVTSTSNGVTVSGSPGNATPVDCSSAFVPLNYVLPASPI
jgi:polygalacturonase